MANPNPKPAPSQSSKNNPEPRRGFMTAALAIVCGTIAGLVPVAAGVAVYLSPWRRQGAGDKLTPVAPMGALPDDGMPRQFAVVAERIDAWNRTIEPIGAVYLRRKPGEEKLECLTATCPHAGCFVTFDEQSKVFKCPCHNSSFAIDGAIIEPSPSPRAMDTLEYEVNEGQILVRYQNFYTGKTEKVAKA